MTDLSRREVASLAIVLICCFAASLGMAFNIDGITDSFNLTNAAAGKIISLEMLSIAAGNLSFARLTERINSKKIFIFGASLIFCFNLLSVFATNSYALTLCRIPAGLALGAVAATCAGTIAKSNKPELNFGAINSAVGLMGVSMAFILPRALKTEITLGPSFQLTGVDGLYLVYGFCALIALIFVVATPGVTPSDKSTEIRKRGGSGIGWLALFAIGLMFFGHASIGLFIVRIGRELNINSENIGYVLMIGSSLGILLPLISGWLGTRVKAFFPILVMATFLVLATLTLSESTATWQYFLAVPIFATLPTAIMPIFLGCLSRLDSSGMQAASHVAFVLTGSSAAPFIGGILIDLGGFAFAGRFAAVAIGLGALLLMPMILAADKKRDQIMIDPSHFSLSEKR